METTKKEKQAVKARVEDAKEKISDILDSATEGATLSEFCCENLYKLKKHTAVPSKYN